MLLKPVIYTLFLLVFSLGYSQIKTEVLEIIMPDKPSLPILTKAFILGQFNYKKDSSFIAVDTKYCSKEIYLNKDVNHAFIAMFNAAKIDGIELKILSGTRNFNEQKYIWERKWERYKNLEPTQRVQKILEFSAMPGTSRHHWGTDLDLNSLSNSYFSSGKGLEIYKWLQNNANTFGFYQVYTEKDINRTGYNLEKWHWSFLPLADTYLKYYNSSVAWSDINGFSGFKQVNKLEVILNYVNGISNKAKHYN